MCVCFVHYTHIQTKGLKMLIQPEAFNQAFKLTRAAVVRILEASGYKDNKISCVEFAGITTEGKFVYKTEYIDLDTGDTAHGHVYVSFNKEGKLVADY